MANLLKLQTLETSDDDSTAVDKQIDKLRKLIPPQMLGHYDRMLARGKKGVAIVKNGVCRGCHVRLAIGVLQVLRHGSDIQICGSCGRYLALDETEEPTAPAKPKRRVRRTKKADAENDS